MTDKERAAAAWTYLTQTTDSYPKWKSRGFPMITNWGKAKTLLDEIVGGVVVPPPPSPPPPTGGTRIPANGIITTGGLWYGDPFVGTVTIQTTEPVTITGDVRNLTGQPLLYADQTPGSRITLDHLSAFGGIDQWDRSGRLILVYRPVSFIARNMTVEGTRGIEITEAAPGATILVTRNRYRNLQGHEANPEVPANSVQFRSVVGVASAEVSWNEIVNEYNKSYMSDGISVYNSSDIKILNNMLWHQSLPGNAPGASSQNGITIEQAGSKNNLVQYNQVVDGHGIGIFAGENNQILDNRVVADQFLPDGTPKGNGAGGCVHIRVGSVNCHAHNNVAGYVTRYGSREDYTLDGAPEGGAAEAAKNTSLPDPITAATEQAEWTRWQGKLTQAGVTIGA